MIVGLYSSIDFVDQNDPNRRSYNTEEMRKFMDEIKKIAESCKKPVVLMHSDPQLPFCKEWVMNANLVFGTFRDKFTKELKLHVIKDRYNAPHVVCDFDGLWHRAMEHPMCKRCGRWIESPELHGPDFCCIECADFYEKEKENRD